MTSTTEWYKMLINKGASLVYCSNYPKVLLMILKFEKSNMKILVLFFFSLHIPGN